MFGGLHLPHYKLLLFINMVTKHCDNLIVLNYIPAGYDYYINENAKCMNMSIHFYMSNVRGMSLYYL